MLETQFPPYEPPLERTPLQAEREGMTAEIDELRHQVDTYAEILGPEAITPKIIDAFYRRFDSFQAHLLDQQDLEFKYNRDRLHQSLEALKAEIRSLYRSDKPEDDTHSDESADDMASTRLIDDVEYEEPESDDEEN